MRDVGGVGGCVCVCVRMMVMVVVVEWWWWFLLLLLLGAGKEAGSRAAMADGQRRFHNQRPDRAW